LTDLDRSIEREMPMADDAQRFQSFEEFFPFYCGEHSRPLTRWLHFAGTHAAGAVVATAVALRRPALLAAAPLAPTSPSSATGRPPSSTLSIHCAAIS